MLNVDPMKLILAIKNGQNPQQLIMSVLENEMASTPMGANLLSLAKEGRTADIEQIVRNISKQRGIDFDKEFPAFKERLGLN